MEITTTIDRRAAAEKLPSKSGRTRLLIASTLIGLAAGGGIFLTTRPTAADLEAARVEAEHARAEAAADYYSAQWWARATTAERQAAYGQAVVEHYQRQWRAMNR